MTRTHPTASRRTLIGCAIAGVMLGTLTAALTLRSPPSPADGGGGDDAQTDATSLVPPAKPLSDDASTIMAALRSAHAELHGTATAGAGRAALPEALTAAITRRNSITEARALAHEVLGPHALVAPGGLTPAGRWVVSRLHGLVDHAIDDAPYDLKLLLPALKAHDGAPLTTGRPSRSDGVDRAQRAVHGILLAQPFQVDAARQQLDGINPRPQDVAQILGRLKAVDDRRVMARTYELETDLMAALFRLVLDFKHIRSAGPFDLRSAARVMRDSQRRRLVIQTVVDATQAASRADADALLAPTHPEYAAMQEAFLHYREVADGGGCPELPTRWRIRPDTRGPRVKRLQERLACEGYYDGDPDGDYGDILLQAVRSYQRHHELHDAGFVYKETLTSLNIPMHRRKTQLALGLQRLRESRVGELGRYYIRVNLPSFALQVVQHGRTVRRHRVVVGTNRLDDDKIKLIQGHLNRTPLFTTLLYRVIANPDWIMPERIQKGEVATKLEKDPDYLTNHNIATVELEGREVLIQKHGPENVLGKVKFLLERTKAIYIHDTDKKWLFEEARRDFSHGCIRIDEAMDFAQWILEEDGWDGAEVKRSLNAEKTQRGMDLKRPVPVITEYITVQMSDEKRPIFLTDIYRYDKAWERGELPPITEARWGDGPLRPSWVPAVPEEVVEQWRAEGMPAPRDYDPTEHAP